MIKLEPFGCIELNQGHLLPNYQFLIMKSHNMQTIRPIKAITPGNNITDGNGNNLFTPI